MSHAPHSNDLHDPNAQRRAVTPQPVPHMYAGHSLHNPIALSGHSRHAPEPRVIAIDRWMHLNESVDDSLSLRLQVVRAIIWRFWLEALGHINTLAMDHSYKPGADRVALQGRFEQYEGTYAVHVTFKRDLEVSTELHHAMIILDRAHDSEHKIFDLCDNTWRDGNHHHVTRFNSREDFYTQVQRLFDAELIHRLVADRREVFVVRLHSDISQDIFLLRKNKQWPKAIAANLAGLTAKQLQAKHYRQRFNILARVVRIGDELDDQQAQQILAELKLKDAANRKETPGTVKRDVNDKSAISLGFRCLLTLSSPRTTKCVPADHSTG